MTEKPMNPNTAPTPRRWLRWLLYLSPFLLAPPLFLAGFIAYNILRPLPDYDAMPAPAPASISFATPSSAPAPSKHSQTIQSASRTPGQSPQSASAPPQTSATLPAIFQVPPPWPPFQLDANTSRALAERFVRLHDQIEACRRDCETFAAVSSRLDLASNEKKIKALAQAIEDADETKDDIRDNLDQRTRQRFYKAHGPLNEAIRRINALRDIHIRFRLDHAIRAGDWQTAGILHYRYMRDLDRAIFYWRKDGMNGYMMICSASVDQVDRALNPVLYKPVDDFFEGVERAWRKAY